MNLSDNLYTELSPFYRNYSSKRRSYLAAIDNIIINTITDRSRRNLQLIDIGAGDGIRGDKIRKKSNIHKLILVDSNKEMITKCKKIKNVEIFQKDITSKKFGFKRKFDYAICLWNVLGHIDKPSKRTTVLKNIYSILKDDSILFIDVNNRNNISQYGIKAVRNTIIDKFIPINTNKNINFSIEIKKNNFIPASVHLFNYKELDNIIKYSKFKVLKKYYIDYNTGEIKKYFFQGQILYILQKSTR